MLGNICIVHMIMTLHFDDVRVHSEKLIIFDYFRHKIAKDIEGSEMSNEKGGWHVSFWPKHLVSTVRKSHFTQIGKLEAEGSFEVRRLNNLF